MSADFTQHKAPGALPQRKHVLGIFYYKILSLQLFIENQDYKGTHHIEHKMPQHVVDTCVCDEENTLSSSHRRDVCY